MQTFLPYVDFIKSAACLDSQRLNKQISEGIQILQANAYGYREHYQVNLPLSIHMHPATLMWKGYEALLACYINECICEWETRGGNNNRTLHKQLFPICSKGQDYVQHISGAPTWLGIEAFHQNHRARLFEKNPEHYRQFNWPRVATTGNLWPVSRRGEWVFMLDGCVVGKISGESKALKYRIPQDRLQDARQCCYCNFWTLPEELNSNGDCEICQSVMAERILLTSLQESGHGKGDPTYDELSDVVLATIYLHRLGFIPSDIAKRII